MKRISIVVPCYNEEETVTIFYNTIIKIIDSLTNYNFEIVFVNDGSKDRTVEIVKSLREKDPRVSLVDFSRNFGKESAMLAGFQSAQGDAVIIMDVDLQDPPSLIPEMIEGWESGYDIVYTKRKNRDGEPPVRSFFSDMFYKIINKMSDVEIINGARDYRIMSRRAVNSLLELKEKNRFSKGLFMWVGYNSKVIEFEHVDRSAGQTKWSFKKLFGYAVEGIISFSDFPLRIASFVGTFISLAAFIFLMYVLVKNIVFQNPVSGWASTISIALFLGGIQLIVLGVIGEYIGRIFNEVKNRPNYIIKDFYESNLSEHCKECENK